MWCYFEKHVDVAAPRFPEKEGREQREEGENLGLVTSPRFPFSE